MSGIAPLKNQKKMMFRSPHNASGTNTFAGFCGLPGRNWGAVSIEVNGGTYGIRTGLSVAGEYGVGSSVFDARAPAIAWVLGRIASTLDLLPTLAKLAGVVAFKRVTPIKACLCFTH